MSADGLWTHQEDVKVCRQTSGYFGTTPCLRFPDVVANLQLSLSLGHSFTSELIEPLEALCKHLVVPRRTHWRSTSRQLLRQTRLYFRTDVAQELLPFFSLGARQLLVRRGHRVLSARFANHGEIKPLLGGGVQHRQCAINRVQKARGIWPVLLDCTVYAELDSRGQFLAANERQYRSAPLAVSVRQGRHTSAGGSGWSRYLTASSAWRDPAAGTIFRSAPIACKVLRMESVSIVSVEPSFSAPKGTIANQTPRGQNGETANERQYRSAPLAAQREPDRQGRHTSAGGWDPARGIGNRPVPQRQQG
jgi:hypothetical protein